MEFLLYLPFWNDLALYVSKRYQTVAFSLVNRLLKKDETLWDGILWELAFLSKHQVSLHLSHPYLMGRMDRFPMEALSAVRRIQRERREEQWYFHTGTDVHDSLCLQTLKIFEWIKILFTNSPQQREIVAGDGGDALSVMPSRFDSSPWL